MFIFSWIKNLFVKPEPAPVTVFEAVHANYGVHIDESPVDTVVVDMNTNWPFPNQAVKAVPAKKVAAKKAPKSK